MAARADPLEWAGAFGPDGIGEDVGVALLEEHGGVVDECDVLGVSANRCWRALRLHVGYEGRPFFRTAG